MTPNGDADLEPERDREQTHAAREDAEAATTGDHPDPETTDPYGASAPADRDWRADALNVPTCPAWCDGYDGDDLCCFRCWFTAEDAPTGDDLTLESAPSTRADGGDAHVPIDRAVLADIEHDVNVLVDGLDVDPAEAIDTVVACAEPVAEANHDAVVRALHERRGDAEDATGREEV